MNGITGHLLPLLTASGELRYVPGMAQVALMLPLGFWVLGSVFRQHGVFAGVVLPLLIGLLAHLVGLIGPELLLPEMAPGIRTPLFVAIMAVLPVLATPLIMRWFRLKEWPSQAGPQSA